MRARLEDALDAQPTADADAAVIELARQYADRIDNYAPSLSTCGPALLRALEELQMTPKARAAITKGTPVVAPTNALDELKRKRASRLNGSSPVDSATS